MTYATTILGALAGMAVAYVVETAALATKVLLPCSTVLVVVGSFTGSPVTLAVGVLAAVFALVAIQRDHEAREDGR